MKYNTAVESFLMYLESIDRSSETIKGYRKELSYFGGYIEEKNPNSKKVKEITIEELESYLYRLKKQGKSSATRSRVVYVFRSFYNYLCKREICEKNLGILLESIKVKQAERVYISAAEFEILTKSIDHEIIRVAVQTMFYTGLRVSETINLNVWDVDLERDLIYVIGGKGNKDRTVPICVKLSKILSNYMNHIRPETESNRFFCTSKTGKLSAQYINVILNEATKVTGIKKQVSAHILRHSFASNLIAKNAPLPTVQKLLGHSDLRVTSRYIHQDIEQLVEAVDLL